MIKRREFLQWSAAIPAASSPYGAKSADTLLHAVAGKLRAPNRCLPFERVGRVRLCFHVTYSSCQMDAVRKKILVDNPARLFGF